MQTHIRLNFSLNGIDDTPCSRYRRVEFLLMPGQNPKSLRQHGLRKLYGSCSLPY